METFLTIAKPSYEAVLNLDQQVRKYMLSAPFEGYQLPEDGVHAPFAYIQQTLVPMFTRASENSVIPVNGTY